MPSRFICAPKGLTLLLITLTSPVANAVIECNSTHNSCEDLLHEGSVCKNGFCTNPFEGGCLRSILRDEKYAEMYDSGSSESILRRRVLGTKRVCNSEDSDSSPFCQPNAADGYSEVRIFPQNWESAIATSWMLQIILSEVLNVPATLETGVTDQNNNFYDEENRMDYGISGGVDMYSSFQHAFIAEGGDCSIYKRENDEVENGEGYVSCAHILPELWDSGQILTDLKKAGVTELPGFTGGAGAEGWYITKFSIERDSSLDYYTGYQDKEGEGSKNRQKLAERFKRPTTWGEYCTLLSANNCSTADDVVARAPAEDGSEDGRYFLEGSYTGYFRATDKNDCTKTKECTGHFMDFPCSWSSYFKQQSYHLGIPLESDGKDVSGGYAYSEMVEIWKAANATKSDLIGQWWTPDATFTSFIGTDSELSKVTLPAATQECYKARASNHRCDADATFLDKYGVKEGSCDEKAIGLKKFAVGNMESNILGNKNPKAAMSPAYELFDNFQLAELQLDDILLAWSSRGIDPYNFDLRFAACKWMADNLEYVTKLIPQSHPRIFVETSFQTASITIAAIVMSTVAIAATVATAFLTSGILKSQSASARRLSIQKNSQTEFAYLLLIGLFFVPVGALLLAVKPSDGTCASSVWLLNVGYTLVFVPTLVRVSAITKVLQAGRRMRRVNVDKMKLLRTSMGISAITAVFCAIWTGVDPMKVQEELSVMNGVTDDWGATVVWVSYYCESESNGWLLFSFVWQCLLLVGGSVLAFQMRSAPPIVNDSREMAFMIYSSSVFLVLRIVLYVLGNTLTGGSLTKASLQRARSLVWGLDSVVNICIYFSKFFRKDEDRRATRVSGIAGLGGGSGPPNPAARRHPTFFNGRAAEGDNGRAVEGEGEKTEESETPHTLCGVCGSQCSVCRSKKVHPSPKFKEGKSTDADGDDVEFNKFLSEKQGERREIGVF